MKRVLYAEDSTTSQLLMRRLLANLCELTITSTLAQAEIALLSQPYDLLITDFLFPEGDTLNFSRSGVDGHIMLEPNDLHVHAKLGFLTAMFKEPIEGEIKRVLKEKF